MSTALKFLHAADLHLARPITGLAEIPAHLKETLANAPYAAAEKVFDVAIQERVDFLLLAGDVVDLDKGGPRAAAFLLGQFERMASKGIHVYWCAGEVDQPERWPNAIQLPDNVTIFPSSLVEQATHFRDGKAVATICGAGMETRRRAASDFRVDDATPFPIALTHGQIDTNGMAAQNIRYWALGGQHQRKLIDKTGSVAVYSGTTQSRDPSEAGAHSCTLVAVDRESRMRVQEFEVDSVRWSLQKITVAENASQSDLKDQLGDRCLKISAEFPDQLILIKWKISTTGEFNSQLRNSQRLEDLVDWLRDEFGQSTAGLWTVALKIDLPRNLPSEWYEEETILGDYLRAVGRFQGDNTLALTVTDYLPENSSEDDWLAELARIPADNREAILRRASLIGVDYLARPDQQENQI